MAAFQIIYDEHRQQQLWQLDTALLAFRSSRSKFPGAGCRYHELTSLLSILSEDVHVGTSTKWIKHLGSMAADSVDIETRKVGICGHPDRHEH